MSQVDREGEEDAKGPPRVSNDKPGRFIVVGSDRGQVERAVSAESRPR